MTIRPVVAVGTAATLLTLLVSCSGTSTPRPAAAPPATTAPAGQAVPEDAVRGAFSGYNAALLRRDFAASCAALTEQARTNLTRGVASKGMPGQSCEQAYGSVYNVPQAAQRLDEATRSTRISGITMNGDTASIAFSGTAGGRASGPRNIRAERVGGTWLIGGPNG